MMKFFDHVYKYVNQAFGKDVEQVFEKMLIKDLKILKCV